MLKNAEGIKIVGRTLSDSIFSELRKDILQGKLRSGEKLSEQKVCSMYGISRTPVREAFRQLELEGLLETIPNRGAFVNGLTQRDIKDLYEMRKAFETIAVRCAIKRITKEEMEKLEEAYEFMEFYTRRNDGAKMLNINMNFHGLIYRASHNRMLSHTLSTYQYYIKQLKVNSAYLDKRLYEVLKEHEDIYKAFIDKDEEAGVKAIETHLDNAKKRAGFVGSF